MQVVLFEKREIMFRFCGRLRVTTLPVDYHGEVGSDLLNVEGSASRSSFLQTHRLPVKGFGLCIVLASTCDGGLDREELGLIERTRHVALHFGFISSICLVCGIELIAL